MLKGLPAARPREEALSKKSTFVTVVLVSAMAAAKMMVAGAVKMEPLVGVMKLTPGGGKASTVTVTGVEMFVAP